MNQRKRMTPEEIKIYAEDIFKSLPVKEDALLFCEIFNTLVDYKLRDTEFKAFVEKALKDSEVYGDFYYAIKISKFGGMLSEREIKDIYTEFTTRYADK